MAEKQLIPLKANKTQRAIITEVFGEEWIEHIEKFLGDIVDLYPYEQWNRDTTGFPFMTIGASKSQDGSFYCIGPDKNVYLKSAFSLFPIKKSIKI